MKNRLFIFAFLSLIVVSCVRFEKYPYKISDFRPELRKHLQSIIADKEIRYSTTSADYFLKDSCSKDELLKLMRFKEPLVRLKAYRAIVFRSDIDQFPILLNHLDDTSKVMWGTSDHTSDSVTVADIMIGTTRTFLTKPQKNKLIDVILTKHFYLNHAQWIIADIEPQEKYYSTIKKLAQKKLNSCSDPNYILGLAKFKKQEDIPLIKKNISVFDQNISCFYNHFNVIEAFPDTTFFPILTNYFEQIIKVHKQKDPYELYYYCRAVAQYRSAKSLAILIALTKPETYPDSAYLEKNKEYVFRAIHKYKSPIYDNLYNALKSQMDDYIIEDLDEISPRDEKFW
ncbi:MAG TPA: hypothetical protein PLP27_04765 [Crocinitomicaceae bacterium]|nr:hypothetical protein [Crocinitomicaceae bacterium]